MAGRQNLIAVVLVAIVLHAILIARTILPAQDGLKLIRVAQQFHSRPWADVVRGSDAHPLYPALIAIAEPVVALFVKERPEAWRITAQLIATAAAVGMLLPIYWLTRRLFDARIACLAVAIGVLLPRIAELGHDTLNNSLGLFATFLALWLGADGLRRSDWKTGAAAGLMAGLGYLTRPEVILVLAAITVTWLLGFRRDRVARSVSQGWVIAAVLMTAMVVVGSYAAVKGEISEKLAVRVVASLGSRPVRVRSAPPPLPGGLNDPRWDFSPKEETERIPIKSWGGAVVRIIDKWWEHLCWLFAVMTVWGVVRQRFIRGLCPDRDPEDVGEIERRLLMVFAAVHMVAVVRHSALLGYISGRHVSALVVASLPWAAAGSFVCARGIAVKLQWPARVAWTAGAAAVAIMIAGSMTVQLMPTHLSHLSRTGYWAAGQWLMEHAEPSQRVLDTRGWARFISGQEGYDYWHVRQALTDSRLSYIIVGLDELEAPSPRAATLNALLAYAATPLIEFPASPGDRTPGVRLYRFERPASWEGLVP